MTWRQRLLIGIVVSVLLVVFVTGCQVGLASMRSQSALMDAQAARQQMLLRQAWCEGFAAAQFARADGLAVQCPASGTVLMKGEP